GAIARLGTVRLRHDQGASSVAFSTARQAWCSAGEDGMIRFWDPKSGKEVGQFRVCQDRINRMALSPDGNQLVTAKYRSGELQFWNAAEGKKLHEHQTAQLSLLALAYAPDRKMLASGGHPGDGVDLWDAIAGKKVGKLDVDHAVYSVVFSPDSKTLAVAG